MSEKRSDATGGRQGMKESSIRFPNENTVVTEGLGLL